MPIYIYEIIFYHIDERLDDDEFMFVPASGIPLAARFDGMLQGLQIPNHTPGHIVINSNMLEHLQATKDNPFVSIERAHVN